MAIALAASAVGTAEATDRVALEKAPATVFASPAGTGDTCSKAAPCSIANAQLKVRAILAAPTDGGSDLVVELADGTYQLDRALDFTPADSGPGDHVVTWRAAAGAHPVLSGGVPVTGWTRTDAAKNIWQATVPADLDTRQFYVGGKRAPVAQGTLAEVGLTLGATAGGYSTTATPPAGLAGLSAAAWKRVEFVYDSATGQWTQSRCRVDSFADSKILMQEPCWTNSTKRVEAQSQFASGGLPSMPAITKPTRIENAYGLLKTGQWYLDRETHTISYIPEPGQNMATIDVVAPRLESLLTVSGTATDPVRNLTFSGLQFSYATWLDPSSARGFSEVQDNLRLTAPVGAPPQGGCIYTVPQGTCPWMALTRPPGNVQVTGGHHITFSRNTFTHLGAAGLVIQYGSKDNLVEGNEFTDISSNAVILGSTDDSNPATAAEIVSGNTISNNLIHDAGAEYKGAAGITLYFTQHTTVSHNELYDLPYTALSGGVVFGHVSRSSHPDTAASINSDLTVSNNLYYDYMKYLPDGGAMYIEGNQGQKILNPDGSIDREASIAHGLLAQDNVAYNGNKSNFAWYDDAGSRWINWNGNVQWANGGNGYGGCSPSGGFKFQNNYSSDNTTPATVIVCLTGNESVDVNTTGQPRTSPPRANAVDVDYFGNTAMPTLPGAGDLPLPKLAASGLTADFRYLTAKTPPAIRYYQADSASTGNPVKIFLAGNGFVPGTQVSVNSSRVDVDIVSPNFLVATAPAGTAVDTLTVTTGNGRLIKSVGGDNIALGKSATQIDSYIDGGATTSNYPASNAVDGNLGNLSATTSRLQPWWQVDLAKSTAVKSIDVYNRTDSCCAARLINYWVFVSDTPFGTKTLAEAQAVPGVWSSLQTTQAGRPSVIDTTGAKGRYLRIQLAGTNELNLGEVVVHPVAVEGNAVTSTVGLTAPAGTVPAGVEHSYPVTVGLSDGSTDGPSVRGTVTVTEGTTVLAESEVTGETAVVPVSLTLPEGEHHLVAAFTSAYPDIAGSVSPPITVTVTGQSFSDVPPGSQFFDDIEWLIASGVTTGFPDGTFKPDAEVERQAMAAFLYRLANSDDTPPACTVQPYPDVPVGSRFCGAISWLKSKNLASGWADGTFRPAASIERQAMAAFLYRATNPGQSPAACTAKPFTDVSVSNSFCGYINWLKTEGVTTGFDDGSFHPGSTVERQAMAAFLHRLH